MKKILSILAVLSVAGCSKPEFNQPYEQPSSIYVSPDFHVPAKYIGEYNRSKDTVSITDKVINITTGIYSVSATVNNSMFYNNCYIKASLPDGTYLEIWFHSDNIGEFVEIFVVSEEVEYNLGRFYKINKQ